MEKYNPYKYVSNWSTRKPAKGGPIMAEIEKLVPNTPKICPALTVPKKSLSLLGKIGIQPP